MERANEDSRGCSIGVSTENKTVTGAQISICISKAQHVTSGCQFAIGYSQVKTLRNGVQLGFFNSAKTLHGIQIGAINFAEDGSDGIQIGVVNVMNDGRFPVMPIFNMGF